MRGAPRRAGRCTVTAMTGFFLLPVPGYAAFEKGGLIGTSPRAAAVSGAYAVLADDVLLTKGSPAGLVNMTGPHVQAAGGFTGQTSLTSSSIGVGTMLEGIGVAALAWQISSPGGYERCYMLSTALPIGEAPWLSLGASLKSLWTDLGTDQASGFGFDASLFANPPLPWKPWEVRLSLGLEDALGSLQWKSGLREDLPHKGHVGLGIRWAQSTALLAEYSLAESVLGRERILAVGTESVISMKGLPIAVRAGWRDGMYREASFSAGVGIRVRVVSLDYALVGLTQSQGNLHLLSAKWIFGNMLPSGSQRGVKLVLPKDSEKPGPPRAPVPKEQVLPFPPDTASKPSWVKVIVFDKQQTMFRSLQTEMVWNLTNVAMNKYLIEKSRDSNYQKTVVLAGLYSISTQASNNLINKLGVSQFTNEKHYHSLLRVIYMINNLQEVMYSRENIKIIEFNLDYDKRFKDLKATDVNLYDRLDSVETAIKKLLTLINDHYAEKYSLPAVVVAVPGATPFIP